MTYACPAWEFAEDNPPFEFAALANQVFPHIGKFSKCRPVCELHMVFQVSYIYDYIIKLCRKKAEVIQNCENANFSHIGKGEARRRNRLKLGGGQAYDRSSTLGSRCNMSYMS
jgi:hypothetical protein